MCIRMTDFELEKSDNGSEFIAYYEDWRHNPTLHQTPVTWAVPAGAGGGAAELVVEQITSPFILKTYQRGSYDNSR